MVFMSKRGNPPFESALGQDSDQAHGQIKPNGEGEIVDQHGSAVVAFLTNVAAHGAAERHYVMAQ